MSDHIHSATGMVKMLEEWDRIHKKSRRQRLIKTIVETAVYLLAVLLVIAAIVAWGYMP